MHVLIACEASGTVCKAFRDCGHHAWSVDTQPTYGSMPQYHIQDDVLQHLSNAPDGKKWDMCIAFPPCTYLTVAGNKWTFHPEDKHLPSAERRPHPRFPDRAQNRDAAVEFVKKYGQQIYLSCALRTLGATVCQLSGKSLTSRYTPTISAGL